MKMREINHYLMTFIMM